MKVERRPIRVFNTLAGQKQLLIPKSPAKLSVYVCGPTVYSYVHIGNGRTFTAFDVVVRYLRYAGYEVQYVRNFTDIDDKIIRAAKERGEDPIRLAAHFVQEFQRDCEALKLIPPDFEPKVSDNIPEIVALIGQLIDRGVAYESAGDVYFAVSRYPAYAKLSKRNLEDLRAGERVQPGEQKREPLDFALWKAAKKGEPAWESPWGPGRPGWHVECSAMAQKYLGETLDVHGGGLDLIFPHHENEIAQSEAVSGTTFVRYWMHAGFLDFEGAKMSKSLGNVVHLRDALERIDPEALRLFFLSTHYRNQLAFSDKALADAEQRMEYFYETLRKGRERLGTSRLAFDRERAPQKYLEEFKARMDDDFNSAGALASVYALCGEINDLATKHARGEKTETSRTLANLLDQVEQMGSVLGIFSENPEEWLLRRRQRAAKQRGIVEARVETLIAQRAEARQNKNFDQADVIRRELLAMGVEVMDSTKGSSWKVIPEP